MGHKRHNAGPIAGTEMSPPANMARFAPCIARSSMSVSEQSRGASMRAQMIRVVASARPIGRSSVSKPSTNQLRASRAAPERYVANWGCPVHRVKERSRCRVTEYVSRAAPGWPPVSPSLAA